MSSFKGKKVWVSGHTGFKGSWLSQWLLDLGAEVHGFALAPPTTPALFDQIGLAKHIDHHIGDVRDAAAVKTHLMAVQPDFVFHLAAQPLVRASYEAPVDTYATNVMGTINVMEALRTLQKPCAAVIVTTDKCYENREWLHGYREEDPLGGYDPYSSSKAAVEIAVASWRRSFFVGHPVRIATARAGNVIGGGDWAKDRIIPDCIRALQQGAAIPVRNKHATRPWQFVLEPLSGYLWLATMLSRNESYASAFNFGPNLDSNRSVERVVMEVLKHWPGKWDDKTDPKASHEAGLLNLTIEKAFHLLGWKPVWGFKKTIEATVSWYRRAQNSDGLAEYTAGQIAAYTADAARAGLPWAA